MNTFIKTKEAEYLEIFVSLNVRGWKTPNMFKTKPLTK